MQHTDSCVCCVINFHTWQSHQNSVFADAAVAECNQGIQDQDQLLKVLCPFLVLILWLSVLSLQCVLLCVNLEPLLTALSQKSDPYLVLRSDWDIFHVVEVRHHQLLLWQEPSSGELFSFRYRLFLVRAGRLRYKVLCSSENKTHVRMHTHIAHMVFTDTTCTYHMLHTYHKPYTYSIAHIHTYYTYTYIHTTHAFSIQYTNTAHKHFIHQTHTVISYKHHPTYTKLQYEQFPFLIHLPLSPWLTTQCLRLPVRHLPKSLLTSLLNFLISEMRSLGWTIPSIDSMTIHTLILLLLSSWPNPTEAPQWIWQYSHQFASTAPPTPLLGDRWLITMTYSLFSCILDSLFIIIIIIHFPLQNNGHLTTAGHHRSHYRLHIVVGRLQGYHLTLIDYILNYKSIFTFVCYSLCVLALQELADWLTVPVLRRLSSSLVNAKLQATGSFL